MKLRIISSINILPTTKHKRKLIFAKTKTDYIISKM